MNHHTSISQNLGDIQGLLARSYSYLPAACFVMLELRNVPSARQWLDSMQGGITPANLKPKEHAVQIAFTWSGMRKLLGGRRLSRSFAREYEEGMVTEARSRILGDTDKNSPDLWQWGSPKSGPVDVVLLLYARSSGELDQLYYRWQRGFSGAGIAVVTRLETHRTGAGKEHFGFKDGISQPLIRGLGGTVAPRNQSLREALDEISAGEFILGYENEYQKIPTGPTLEEGDFDLGRNGSYMVIRQLEQDVEGFWNYLHTAVQSPELRGIDAIELGAKMIGRWPNGNPLSIVSDRGAAPLADQNEFSYHAADPMGEQCPIGAHARRSNPRDTIDPGDPETSIRISRRHRILRRGRSFGPPLYENMDVERREESSERSASRGLHFICLNANIGRQYEFIQHTWNNNPKFAGLNNDIDPIIGFPIREDEYLPGEFTLQGCPVRKKAIGIPQFVFVRGGAYFFMPGLTALRRILEAP